MLTNPAGMNTLTRAIIGCGIRRLWAVRWWAREARCGGGERPAITSDPGRCGRLWSPVAHPHRPLALRASGTIEPSL